MIEFFQRKIRNSTFKRRIPPFFNLSSVSTSSPLPGENKGNQSHQLKTIIQHTLCSYLISVEVSWIILCRFASPQHYLSFCSILESLVSLITLDSLVFPPFSHDQNQPFQLHLLSIIDCLVIGKRCECWFTPNPHHKLTGLTGAI